MAEKKTFYITTPIYYPSAKLHIGHTYCTSVADTIARFKRLAGYDVRFLTGSDEHGQKIQRAAEKEGITPYEYVTRIVNGFKDLWKHLDISNDDFIRTTDKRHEKVVQELFQKAYDKGDIYKAEYEGWYCTPCESFWTELNLGPDHTCPDCGRPVEKVKEESYFFKMNKYADQWLKFIDENPDFIQPESRRNEMIQFVKQGLEDLAVSRTSFDWGIKVPFDPKHVVYVWFDALVNYISALEPGEHKGELYKKYWPADLHLVGKEIVRFHTIIWPIMLMSLDLPLPKKVFGHGWMIVDGTKMSKSLGNVIDPVPLIETYGSDALRYFLLSEIQLGKDGNFTLPGFVQKVNTDLANDLGNLLNRTVAMVNKYHDGLLTNVGDLDGLDKDLSSMAIATAKEFEEHMEAMELNKAIRTVWTFISRTNKYIDETMPWALAKSEDTADQKRLQAVMYHLAESLRIIAILVSPILTKGAPKIWEQLGLSGFDQVTLADAKVWGQIPNGTKVVKGDPIYPRFEMPEMVDVAEAKVASTRKENEASREVAGEGTSEAFEPLKEEISFDDFEKLDMRVAKVLTCEKVPKSKKLLLFTLDIGLETRTVVSGISQFYAPEDLIGKKVIYLANLKPRKIMGIESAGMILSAADIDHNLEVTNVADSKPGATIG